MARLSVFTRIQSILSDYTTDRMSLEAITESYHSKYKASIDEDIYEECLRNHLNEIMKYERHQDTVYLDSLLKQRIRRINLSQYLKRQPNAAIINRITSSIIQEWLFVSWRDVYDENTDVIKSLVFRRFELLVD
jgi:hypothetical protein